TAATTTSANGLTITTQSNVGGVSLNTVDATVVNADGSRAETVSVASANGTLLSKHVTTTSADRKTKTITSDLNGDGQADRIEIIAEQANGSVTDTVSTYAPNGAFVTQTQTTTSANGLSKTATTNIDGKIDGTTTDVTVLNADGSKTETVTQLANNGAQIAQ